MEDTDIALILAELQDIKERLSALEHRNSIEQAKQTWNNWQDFRTIAQRIRGNHDTETGNIR